MFKLMNFSGDDIRLDAQVVSDAVTNACRRNRLRVEGTAVSDDVLTVICSSGEGFYTYRLTSLGQVSRQDLFAELRSRYDSSFRTAGAFQLADGIWTLTEKSESRLKTEGE